MENFTLPISPVVSITHLRIALVATVTGAACHLPIIAAQDPKLGLNHLRPVISLERLSYLSEERRVSGHKVAVGGRSWSGSIPCPIATMSRVGHKLPQQLSMLV
jgi:hypothetical protein